MNRRILALLGILMALSLLAAACGNSGDDDSSPPSGTDDTETDDPSPAAETGETETGETETGETETGETETGETDRHEFIAIEGVPGVSDDAISVGVVGIREFNPLGTCILDCYITGVQAYFDYINDGGGIYGRELRIGEEFDDQLFQNQQAALDLISNGESFASFQATLGASGWGDLHEAGVPTFAWNIHGTAFANRDSIFGHAAAACATCIDRVPSWLASVAGATKVGTIGYGDSENSRTCAETTGEGFEFYGEQLGFELVYENTNLEFGLAGGVGPEVSQMIESGVDYIATCIDLNGMRTLAEELVRQDYRDQITLQHPNTYNADFVAEAGSLFDGDFTIPGFAALEYDTGSELAALYDVWVPAQGGPLAEQTMVGWINADLMFEGLLAAGPDFDREKLIDALNTMIYSPGGLINPIDWSRQHIPPTEGDPTNDYEFECASAVQMQDGVFVGFQSEPFMCWPNDTIEWSEPVPTNFAVG